MSIFFLLSVCPSSSAQVKRKAHYIIQYFVSLFFYYLFLFYIFCLFLPLYLSICFFLLFILLFNLFLFHYQYIPFLYKSFFSIFFTYFNPDAYPISLAPFHVYFLFIVLNFCIYFIPPYSSLRFLSTCRFYAFYHVNHISFASIICLPFFN